MSRASLHHGMNQIPVVGQQQKPFGILVKPAGISDADRVFHLAGNGLFGKSVLLRTGHAGRLIVGQNHLIIFPANRPAIHGNLVVIIYLHTHSGLFTVYQHPALFYKPVSLPAGADAAGSQVFI